MDYVLVHHGIKGMRWGVRRFQNANGNLTAAGRKRYSTSDEGERAPKRKGLSSGQKTAIKVGAAFVAASLVTFGAVKLAKSGKISDLAETGKQFFSKRKSKLDLSKISTEELMEMNKRDAAENLYRKNHPTKSTFKKGLETVNKVNSATNAFLNLYTNGKRVEDIMKKRRASSKGQNKHHADT